MSNRRDLKEIAGPLAVILLSLAVAFTAIGLVVDVLLGHKLMPIDQSALASVLGAAVGVIGTYIGLTLGQQRNRHSKNGDEKE